MKDVRIIAYDEKTLHLSNGEKIEAPTGYSYNVDDIKKILEAGD